MPNITRKEKENQNEDQKKERKKKNKQPHSVSRLQSVQNSVSDVLNCHGQKLAHLSRMQCQTNLHFYTDQNRCLFSATFIYALTNVKRVR